MTPGAEVFLSHKWRENESTCNSHDQVSLINKELKQLDYETWFEAELMTGDVAKQMSQRIERTKDAIAFNTTKIH